MDGTIPQYWDSNGDDNAHPNATRQRTKKVISDRSISNLNKLLKNLNREQRIVLPIVVIR